MFKCMHSYLSNKQFYLQFQNTRILGLLYTFTCLCCILYTAIWVVMMAIRSITFRPYSIKCSQSTIWSTYHVQNLVSRFCLLWNEDITALWTDYGYFLGRIVMSSMIFVIFYVMSCPPAYFNHIFSIIYFVSHCPLFLVDHILRAIWHPNRSDCCVHSTFNKLLLTFQHIIIIWYRTNALHKLYAIVSWTTPNQ